ncbi:hypothetical protein ACOME3_004647 [Neoechinorhynchus agilis]
MNEYPVNKETMDRKREQSVRDPYSGRISNRLDINNGVYTKAKYKECPALYQSNNFNETQIQKGSIIIRRRYPGKIEPYRQVISIRYLQPPPIPPPGPIIIREIRPPRQPTPPPIHIRQIPRPPATPPPIILRERPPVRPRQVPTHIVYKQLPASPPPTRKIIVERLSPLPPKPQHVYIDRWIPYPEMEKKNIIYPKTSHLDSLHSSKGTVVVRDQVPMPSQKVENSREGQIYCGINSKYYCSSMLEDRTVSTEINDPRDRMVAQHFISIGNTSTKMVKHIELQMSPNDSSSICSIANFNKTSNKCTSEIDNQSQDASELLSAVEAQRDFSNGHQCISSLTGCPERDRNSVRI